MPEQIITIIKNQGKSTRLGYSADKSMRRLKSNNSSPVLSVFMKEVSKKILKNKVDITPR